MYTYVAVSTGAAVGPVLSVGLKIIIPFLTLKCYRSKVYEQYSRVYHQSHVACSWQTSTPGLLPLGHGGPVLVVEAQDLILGRLRKSGPVDPAAAAADVPLLDIVKIYGDFALDPPDPVRRGVGLDQRHSLVLLG